MQSRLLQSIGGRSYALVLDEGDEVKKWLLEFARDNDLHSARFTAVGALSEATLAYFDAEERKYRDIPVREQVEVASFIGNIARFEGDLKAHIHCVLGRRDGTALAGHFKDGKVNPTLEIMVEELVFSLDRERDPKTGLALLRV